jgi:hypothetical protein
VVAFGMGGALETILDGKTGVFFNEQTMEGLIGAIRRLEQLNFDSAAIRRHAEGFDRALFRERLFSLIKEIMKKL